MEGVLEGALGARTKVCRKGKDGKKVSREGGRIEMEMVGGVGREEWIGVEGDRGG